MRKVSAAGSFKRVLQIRKHERHAIGLSAQLYEETLTGEVVGRGKFVNGAQHRHRTGGDGGIGLPKRFFHIPQRHEGAGSEFQSAPDSGV